MFILLEYKLKNTLSAICLGQVNQSCTTVTLVCLFMVFQIHCQNLFENPTLQVLKVVNMSRKH